MIQLIDCLPFEFSDIESLKDDWVRYKEGRVTFDQVPNGVSGEYFCEAEMQVNGSCAGSGDEESEENEYERELLKYLPSGRGRLIITISKLYWISVNENPSINPTGWSIDYQHLLLHAISKPSESRPYIYLQLSCNKVYDINGHEISFGDDENGAEEEKYVEVNLYVDGGEKAVDDIFVALSECTSLHPCEDNDSDDDGEFDYDNDDNESEDDNSESTESSDEPQRKVNKLDEERFEDAAEK